MRCNAAAAVLVVATFVLAPATSRAQEMREDSAWNGVVTGAAVGAAVGIVLAETTEEVCSVGACMALLAVVGSAVGLAVDRIVGRALPVEPGSAVDDPLWNGALIGSGVASAVALIDFARICRTPRGCTTEGVIRAAVRAALFGSAVGALVDAAIPSKAAAPNGGVATTGSRRLSLAFGVCF